MQKSFVLQSRGLGIVLHPCEETVMGAASLIPLPPLFRSFALQALGSSKSGEARVDAPGRGPRRIDGELRLLGSSEASE
jgi:hypothetical protein